MQLVQHGSRRDVPIVPVGHSLWTLPPPEEQPPQNGGEAQHTQ
jgi:hypothetical protein